MGARGQYHTKFKLPDGTRIVTETYHIRLAQGTREQLSKLAFDLSMAQGKYVPVADLVRMWIKEKLGEHAAKQATVSKAPSYGK